jgi:selenocysteine lyase/cysteine desulfurase
MAFFNHAGVAPISARAAAALRQYAEQAETTAYVGHGWYKRIKQVRESAARLINARGAHEIAFIPNTSTGLALVARGIDWRPGDNVVITNVEYPANRYPWQDLQRLGVELIEVRQSEDGRIHHDDVADAVNDRTRIVAVSHVQYASGHRLNLRPIADMVHHAGGHLCVDAIQSVGVLPVDVQAMGVDFLAADGHKWMLGPEGAGVFYAHQDLIPLLHPAVVGWMNMIDANNYGDYRFEFQMDARRFEPGTYNVPGILALGASIDLLLEVGIDNVWPRVESLTQRLCDGLRDKGYRVFTPRDDPAERSGIVCFEPRENGKAARQQIVDSLEQRGIVIVEREGRLRASPHFYNGDEQIDAMGDALA